MDKDRLVEKLPLGSLQPSPRNPRTHSRRQIRQIADSIATFGFTNPVLIDRNNTILAGHGRVAAARLLGMDAVPCIRLEHMTAAQKRAYVIADNKLALNAGWDEELLAEELRHLLSIDLDFDIGITGFSVAEVDLLIEGLTPEEPGDPAEDRLPDTEGPSRCRPGDLWELGPHRLLCGNALDAHAYERLLGSERAQMVFADPPYNVRIDGHAGGLGAVKHREFAMACGEMSEQEYTRFLATAFANLAAYSLDGSIHFVCNDWRHVREVLDAGRTAYTELKNLIVWAKDNGGMGTFYRSRHELIFAFKNGNAPHINSFELGQHGRHRTNLWQYRGAKRNRLPALHEERMKQIILEEAYRTIRVNDGRRQVTISMAKAVIRSMALSAAKGQSRAQRLFSELLAGTERSNKALHDEWLAIACEYKSGWEFELERRRRLGIEAPDPIPHPDHIEIDMRTGTVIVKGPMTKEEKKKWDRLRERKAECDEAIAEYEAQLKDEAYADHRKFILEELERERNLRAMIARVIRD
jgi:hypothetical protein